jgi:IS5 family transposase
VRALSAAARALPNNPYDGHTLRVDRTETLTGCPIERAYVDKGVPRPQRAKSSQKFVFGVIKRRRSAIEPLIGHLKTEAHLGCCCYLKGCARDAANACSASLLADATHVHRF